MFSLFLSCLFPRRCPICCHILKSPQNLICPECYKKIEFVREPVCFCCGKPLEDEGTEFCSDCRKHPKSFQKGVALCLYNNEVRDSLAALKYENQKEFAEFYVEEIRRKKAVLLKKLNADLVIPVPLHKRKKRQRGFNQAMLFAEGIGNILNCPVSEYALIRTKYTRPLKTLTPRERQEAMEHSFWASDEVRGKRILLVDDIYTTGATAECCAKELKDKGASAVYVFCIAIGRGL
ncbi:ComF family protein [Anaerostipes sp.]|uniref:ComF family protein n=1 Tax=Anaerostipes sp. TaxID=1872530 RepID=UPI0025B9B82D|nr:ComF family protein [Anaerostipes sp.]MBS7008933.1 ComF family protein [Anaerostipes sp.]